MTPRKQSGDVIPYFSKISIWHIIPPNVELYMQLRGMIEYHKHKSNYLFTDQNVSDLINLRKYVLKLGDPVIIGSAYHLVFSPTFMHGSIHICPEVMLNRDVAKKAMTRCGEELDSFVQI